MNNISDMFSRSEQIPRVFCAVHDHETERTVQAGFLIPDLIQYRFFSLSQIMNEHVGAPKSNVGFISHYYLH